MLLRLERKRVHVDTNRRDVGVVLVRLHQVEVGALTDLEAVVAVELDERRDNGVLARHALNTGDGVARLNDRAIPPVRVVKRLLALPWVDDAVIAADKRVTLNNPDKLLTRVVKVQLELVRARRDRLTARELEHINEVLVRDLGELAALIRVQVDVIHIEGGGGETRLRNTVANSMRVRAVGIVPAEIVEGVELKIDAHLVVLEGDEGERKSRVAAEPELEGHVERVHRCAAANALREAGLTGIAVVVARDTALDNEVRELRDVTNHLGVTGLFARLLRELVPDVEPVTIVLVNALTANLKLHVGDEVVANPVEPAELRTRAVRELDSDLGERGLEVDAVDKITVALNRARDLLAEVRGAIEGVFNRLHREVSVATVYNFEKSNLRVTCKVHILSAVSYELH